MRNRRRSNEPLESDRQDAAAGTGGGDDGTSRGQKRLWQNAAAFPFVLAVIAITGLVIWFLAR